MDHISNKTKLNTASVPSRWSLHTNTHLSREHKMNETSFPVRLITKKNDSTLCSNPNMYSKRIKQLQLIQQIKQIYGNKLKRIKKEFPSVKLKRVYWRKNLIHELSYRNMNVAQFNAMMRIEFLDFVVPQIHTTRVFELAVESHYKRTNPDKHLRISPLHRTKYSLVMLDHLKQRHWMNYWHCYTQHKKEDSQRPQAAKRLVFRIWEKFTEECQNSEWLRTDIHKSEWVRTKVGWMGHEFWHHECSEPLKEKIHECFDQ
jgi:hypothetical protein